MLTGNVNTSKAMAKEHCECVIRSFSDKVRAGKGIKSEIPYVGSLLIRGGLAGILFDSELVQKVKGRTPINYGVRLHSADLCRNNLMSGKLFERSKSSEKFSKMKRQLDREYHE